MKATLIFKRLLTSVCISVAILSIANIDTLKSEGEHNDVGFAREKMREAKVRLRQSLEVSEQKTAKPRGLVNMLRDSLAQDEFIDTLPFANLSTLDPLNKIFEKGVKHFERTVFRSPDYQSESGYDLVQYDIEHTNGAHSTILAYLDRPMLTASRNVGTPDARIPVVMIMNAQGEGLSYSHYRAGNLLEQSDLSSADATGLVAQRIALSIPFLSVSR